MHHIITMLAISINLFLMAEYETRNQLLREQWTRSPSVLFSDNGTLRLLIDPVAIEKSIVYYRMTSHGHEVWAKEHPYWVAQSYISASGQVFGYATLPFNNVRNRTEWHILAFNNLGNVSHDEIVPSRNDVDMSIAGMFYNQGNDSLYFRIRSASGSEQWWRYVLPDFERAGVLAISPPNKYDFEYLVAVDPIGNTSLVCLHWFGKSASRLGDSVFQIANASGSVLAEYSLVGEHDNLASWKDINRDHKKWVQVSSDGVLIRSRAKATVRMNVFRSLGREDWHITQETVE